MYRSQVLLGNYFLRSFPVIELSGFDGEERESEHRARVLPGIRPGKEKYSGESGNP